MISLADLQRRIERASFRLMPPSRIRTRRSRPGRRTSTPSSVTHKSAKAQPPARCAASRSGSRTSSTPPNLPTEMGSPIYRGWRPRADAPVVMVLKRAGATIIGKTTTTALRPRDPTATLNPHNHGHTPGGSSSGSAAAVGAGMIPLALGTQTGGSVIRPASFCGAAAIKPSLPAVADGRRQMLFVDARHRRAVRAPA